MRDFRRTLKYVGTTIGGIHNRGVVIFFSPGKGGVRNSLWEWIRMSGRGVVPQPHWKGLLSYMKGNDRDFKFDFKDLHKTDNEIVDLYNKDIVMKLMVKEEYFYICLDVGGVGTRRRKIKR
ncbi:hypothetical protein Fmac_025028 [Flemingia macrophylla]|uniref:Uncharacterized protein n=1 Tax=Flemingia macrophylla TaxID=520843 RepID=A0ABD1LST2_9FABA